MTLSLNDVGVLVTRPAGQADALCQAIEAQGGHAYHVPAMEIHPVADPTAVTQRVQDLCACDVAIFISINAVSYASQLLADDLRRCLQHKTVAAIGRGTARCLADCGIQVTVVPGQGRFDSEALLQHPALQTLADKRVLIIRGTGGREVLADGLRQRGAEVSYLEAYRRQRPAANNAELRQLLARGRIQVVVTTSNEILQNLYDMLGQQERTGLLQLPLVVMSQRAADLARELGFSAEPVIAKDASTDALLKAIELCASQ
jgi:uroporphyrinogen-III synthase